jgi:hypothetical protein
MVRRGAGLRHAGLVQGHSDRPFVISSMMFSYPPTLPIHVGDTVPICFQAKLVSVLYMLA